AVEVFLQHPLGMTAQRQLTTVALEPGYVHSIRLDGAVHAHVSPSRRSMFLLTMREFPLASMSGQYRFDKRRNCEGRKDELSRARSQESREKIAGGVQIDSASDTCCDECAHAALLLSTAGNQAAANVAATV